MLLIYLNILISLQKEQANNLTPKLSQNLQKCLKLGQEKGVSLWLTAHCQAIERIGFSLHKSDFRDAVALCYGFPLQRTPSHCVCVATFSVWSMLCLVTQVE